MDINLLENDRGLAEKSSLQNLELMKFSGRMRTAKLTTIKWVAKGVRKN